MSDKQENKHAALIDFLKLMDNNGLTLKDVIKTLETGNGWECQEEVTGIFTDEEQALPVGHKSEDETQLAGSPDVMDVDAIRRLDSKSSQENHEIISSTPIKSSSPKPLEARPNNVVIIDASNHERVYTKSPKKVLFKENVSAIQHHPSKDTSNSPSRDPAQHTSTRTTIRSTEVTPLWSLYKPGKIRKIQDEWSATQHRSRELDKMRGSVRRSFIEEMSHKQDLTPSTSRLSSVDGDRASVDAVKLFNSRQDDLNKSTDGQTPPYSSTIPPIRPPSADVKNIIKKSGREGARPVSGMTPKGLIHTKGSLVATANHDGIQKDKITRSSMRSTVESLENALHDIYRQDLRDELQITEMRRDAVRRFVSWKDAVNSEIDKYSSASTCFQGQNSRLCDWTAEGGSQGTADISEGPLSGIDTSDSDQLKIEDLQDVTEDSTVFAEYDKQASLRRSMQGRLELEGSYAPLHSSLGTSFMKCPDTMLIGEVAFQLERMILTRTFRGGSKQLIGYTLMNMEQMIATHYDYRERPMLRRQLIEIQKNLTICGWNEDYHPRLVSHLIRIYGTFPSNAKAMRAARERGWLSPRALRQAVLVRIPRELVRAMVVILDCLFFFSEKYDTSLFAL